MELLTQFNIVKTMKKIQSAYFYSIFLFSSSLVLVFLHYMKSYSSVSLASLLKFNIDRNHVFLICNGILVILVKSSSSLSNDSSSTDYNNSSGTNTVQSNDQCFPRTVELSEQRKQQEFSAVTSEQKVTTDVKIARFSSVEETVVSEVLNVHEQQKVVVSECEVVHSYVLQHDDHDNVEVEVEVEVEAEVDDDEEGAEELNKRCEEFIRRMKQGIISESRKDLSLARFS